MPKPVEYVFVRAAREGLKVPLATDVGPSYFDHSAQPKFQRVPLTRYIRRRLNEGDLIKASDVELAALQAEGLTGEQPAAHEPG